MDLLAEALNRRVRFGPLKYWGRAMISPIAGLIFMDEDLDAEDRPEDQLPAEPTVLQKLSGDDLEDLLPVLLTL